MSDPLTIQDTVTGSQAANGPNPSLPRTPAVIAAAALEAWRGGAILGLDG